jgi:hypothetical protein
MSLQGRALLPPAGRAPTLQSELLGRYAETERYNRLAYQGSVTALDQWHEIRVDRPTILLPQGQLDGSVFFRPHGRPVTHASGDARRLAQKAVGPGVVFLHAPGAWFLHYHGTGIAEFLQIAAEDPNIAASLLATPGYQKATFTSLTTAGINTSETLIAANLYRRGISIYCKNGTNVCAITIGGQTASVVAPLNGHLISGPAASLQLWGGLCPTSSLNVASNAAGQDISVAEYE